MSGPDLARDGWTRLPHDPRTAAWAAAAGQVAQAVLADPAMRARWLRHGQTWFVGVDALPNAPDGSIQGVPLAGPWDDIVHWTGPWHPAQLSVVFPGYPRRDPDESDQAHRFRRDRDAAHLDGLLAEGPDRRRHLREPHAFILGLPLTPVTTGMSPFVVWEGSHRLIAAALRAAFGATDPAHWGDIDLTDTYAAARRAVFATCRRVEVMAQPGEAILCDRRTIHGVAPWTDASSLPDGRAVAWFRPLLDNPADWLGD